MIAMQLRVDPYGQARLLRFLLQESFVVLLPYLLLISALTLGVQLIGYVSGSGSEAVSAGAAVARVTRNILPLMIVLSVAYHTSVLNDVDRLTSIILSSTVFIVVVVIENGGSLSQLPRLASVSAILAPLLSCFLLRVLGAPIERRFANAGLHPSLAHALAMIFPFIASVVLSVPALFLVSAAIRRLTGVVAQAADLVALPAELMLLELLNGAIWFFGLHGTSFISLFVPARFFSQFMAENLTYAEFIDLFVGFGGSGSVLGLILAILLMVRDQRLRSIAYLSLPFALFNISEPIIYGLPIILNFRLLAPFLLAPLVNMGLSILVVSTGVFSFSDSGAPWPTPIGVSGYLHTGQTLAVAYQFALLALNVAVYAPFIRRFSLDSGEDALRAVLDDRIDLQSKIQAHGTRAHQDGINAGMRLQMQVAAAIRKVRDNELAVHYQPKYAVDTQRCIGFESLLRLQLRSGEVVGPSFLPSLEDAGYASVIDGWVCARVLRDLPLFEASDPGWTVSINLHPDSLADGGFVTRLIEQFVGRSVTFEIIERGFSSSPEVIEQIRRMHDAGLVLEVDDFGAGYANLSSLGVLPVRMIKLDQSLLRQATGERGRALFRSVADMCHAMGYRVLAEGVERVDQLEFVANCGVPCAQGWLFSKALPLEEAVKVAHSPPLRPDR